MLLYMGQGSALASYRRQLQVRALSECGTACGALLGSLLGRFGPGLELENETRNRLGAGIESARDCQELCSLAAWLLGRRSALVPHVLAPLHEACQRCAAACDQLSECDGAARCAELCRVAREIGHELQRSS